MTSQDHAVVAGASMAGLLAAAVLADHHRRVTVVEPDALDPEPVAHATGAKAWAHRRGVPQSEHAHALLPRGADALEELFPGLRAELADAGAIVSPARMGPDRGMRLVGPSGVFTDVEADGSAFVGVSRSLLEGRVRRRLLARPNVRVVRARADGLAATDDGARVTGLRVRDADDRDGAPWVIDADLVVDATGRRSSAPRWLGDIGYADIPETVIQTGVGYASRWYRRPAERRAGWDASIVNARPGVNPRVAVLLPVEGGFFTVSLGGVAGHHPPTDEAGFLKWARDLPDPGIAEAIAESEPVSGIRGYRTPTSRLRHVERLTRWPAGFLMTGDAVCAFNPIYGQGMSVSALEALALRDVLAGCSTTVEADFRRRVAAIVATPWAVASGEDRRWVGGARSRSDRARDRYTDAVRSAATADPAVAYAFALVMLMQAGPASLVRPAVAGRVLRHRLRRGPARPRPAGVPDRLAERGPTSTRRRSWAASRPEPGLEARARDVSTDTTSSS